VEDHVREERPIKGPILTQYGTAERVAHSEIRGQTGLRHIVSNLVRVYYGPTERNEVFGRRRFTGTNAARNDNSFHLTTVATACDIAIAKAK
jgi:hypothetical protein